MTGNGEDKRALPLFNMQYVVREERTKYDIVLLRCMYFFLWYAGVCVCVCVCVCVFVCVWERFFKYLFY